jgi:DNA-binding PadR family transcriptional regulator
MTSRPTATSFAILGLLAIQPWTAYELVAQSKRSLHWFWPRSEANLYAELKRLVERGHAQAEVVEGRGRQRTRYTITPSGQIALQDWLRSEPAPPSLEIEGLLRVLLADQGTAEELRAAIDATARQARERSSRGLVMIDEMLTTGGPLPNRAHLTERVGNFYAEYLQLLIRWCDETLVEVESWPSTRDVGLTPRGRERLEAIARSDPDRPETYTLDRH